MLPYPYGHSELCKAAFCHREKSVVRKKPECWTCSWCEPRSDVMVSAAPEAPHCKVVPMFSHGRAPGNPLHRAA